ncbi:MAG TPA: MFS transporter [Anaeromyxobacteraceae bacterium]|nr:MFS transporter [Anaeromyxobacteraceae bacterium]
MPDASTTPAAPRHGLAAMALVSLALFGNFYVYDSIGPVAELLQRQLGFSDTQIGTLNAIYSLPNVVLILVGGILVDRFGAGRVFAWTAGVCFAGAVLTAASPSFPVMAAGRLLYGVGAETFNIASLAAVTLFYPRRHTALMMGITLGMGRAGSWVADLSPTIAAPAYARGWQGALALAAVVAATSFAASVAYHALERRAAPAGQAERQAQPFSPRDLLGFGRPYWYLLVLCVLWYAVILAFRSTFAIKYFQHAHGLGLEEAGQINAHVFLAALFATPLFGWLCDRTGRHAALQAFGALLLPASLLVMTRGYGLGVATVLIGVSYSLVPAAMWPLVSRLVAPSRFGTAIGLMWIVQNAGIAGANLVAGRLNDAAGASAANPAGYGPMMAFFTASSAAGCVFAVLLWARTRGREAVALSPAP